MKIYKKAQAPAELAIFGTLMLVVFGMIISYGQRFDFRQAVKMEAFRKALRSAYYLNGAVSYTVQKDGRQVDIMSGFGQGQPTSASSTTSLIWAKGSTGNNSDSKGDRNQAMTVGLPGGTDKNYALHELNGKIIEMPRYKKLSISESGTETWVDAPASIYTQQVSRATKYAETTADTEDGDTGTIVNKRDSTISETQTVDLDMRFDYGTHDARNNPLDYIPSYAYENSDYTYDGEGGRIGELPAITFVSAQENGRVVFKEAQPGQEPESITQSETWTTPKKDTN